MAPLDTRTRILDAAEHLFAERGFRGTSVRAITDLAGANLAAVGYHFGSKAELLAAVIRRVIEPIIAAQHAGLDRLLGRGHGPRSLPSGLRARAARPFPARTVVPDAGDPRRGGRGPCRCLQPAPFGEPVPGGGRGCPALGNHVSDGSDERATDRDLTTRRNWRRYSRSDPA